MNFLDHIGLSGEFIPCDNNLPYINRNFRIIDSILQMNAVSFVDAPPANPEAGDVYIIENGSYTYGIGESVIGIFNGTGWIFLEPKLGYQTYVESESAFFWFNGSDWVLDAKGDGTVNGPVSSLNNSIARFDGTAGKFITDSGVILDDDNVISGVNSIYTDKVIFKDLYAEASVFYEFPAGILFVGSSFGIIQTPIAQLDSFYIPTKDNSFIFLIENKTGAPCLIKNSIGLLTGTGKDFIFKDGTSLIVYYSKESDTFNIISGSGGSGGGIITVADKVERDDILEDDRYPGLMVFINDEDFQIQTTYQLVGGITNSHWKILAGGNNSIKTLNAFGGPVFESDHHILLEATSDNVGASIQTGMPVGKEFTFLRTASSTEFEFNATITLPGSETFLDGTTSYTLPEVGDYLKIIKINSTTWGKYS